MKRLTFTIVALALLLSGCINEYGKPPEAPTPVKFSELLQNPPQWQGKLVNIEGTFNWEFEGDAIFETKQDQKLRNTKKAISLVLDSRTLGIPEIDNKNINILRKIFVPLSLRLHIGKPAIVRGTFQTQSFGGLYVGTIYVKQLVLK